MTQSAPVLINNIILDNNPKGIVGVYCTPTVINCILWGNVDDLDHCDATYSNIEDGDPGEGNICVNPMFVDAAGGDYHLQAGSPCIDAGANEGAPSTDFEGNPRPIDGDGDGIAVVDMGAFEFVPMEVLEATVDIHPYTLNLRSGGKWITAYVQLPEGYDAEDIDAATILLNETIQPVLDPKYEFVTNSSEYLVDHNEDGISERMVKFDKAGVMALLSVGEATLTITGEVNGTPFEGSDSVRVR